ncbi:TPA: replication initiation protein, partial [Enterococcus faecium]
MNNSIVRYANGLNAVPLRSFSSVDMDLFWAICSKMKRKGVHEELLSFEEIKFMISYDPSKGLDRFYTELIKMSNKLSTMYFIYQTENIYDRLNLFQRFKIDKDNQTVLVKVSDEFEWILNNIGKNFTRFELETMTQLSSTYTKELYRQLMAH